MDKYHCPCCTDKLGHRPPVPEDPLTSAYQQVKREKHTKPSTAFAEQSVLDCVEEQYYADCIRETIERGGVHESYRGTNVVFCPSTQSTFAMKYKWGKAGEGLDTVVVVKTSEPQLLHPKFEPSSNYSNVACDDCGGPFLPLRC